MTATSHYNYKINNYYSTFNTQTNVILKCQHQKIRKEKDYKQKTC